MMHQPIAELPTEIYVDGLLERNGIRYLGTARQQRDGRWVALADVEGCLCWVEVKVTFDETRFG
jgi:hypothetical protein